MKQYLTSRTNIRLTDEEHAGLKRFAEENYLDVSKAVRRIVCEYLRANKFIKKPTKAR